MFSFTCNKLNEWYDMKYSNIGKATTVSRYWIYILIWLHRKIQCFWCINIHSIHKAMKNKWYFYWNIKYGWMQIILLNKLLLQYHRCCFTRTKSQVLMRYIWDTYFIMLSCKFSFKSYICIPLNLFHINCITDSKYIFPLWYYTIYV